MKLGVSNIAWPADLQSQAADVLQSLGVGGVEIAPTTVWSAPLEVSSSERAAFRRFWNDRGIEVIALQSLLFGRLDLSLFGSAESRQLMKQYLSGMIQLCAELGGRALVFGSPKNRKRGDLDPAAASHIAAEFFADVGECARRHGVVFCVEANPPAYDCDFITTSAQAVSLVQQVDDGGFGVHLDTGAMTLSEEAIAEAVSNAMPWCRHFHISEPQLKPVGTGGVDHQTFATTLAACGYGQWTSIEMRVRSREVCLSDLSESIAFAQRTYGQL